MADERQSPAQGLTHLDETGAVHMVDVGGKAVTERVARAQALVKAAPETLDAIQREGLPKGDVLATVRLAAIMGAKRTSELIPLCHPLPLSAVRVDITLLPDEARVRIEVEVKTRGRTGVEMEAMTACSIAALTLYDMCKAVDRAMVIESVQLLHKSGGKSGTWERRPE